MAQARCPTPHWSATSKAKLNVRSNFDSIREDLRRNEKLFEDPLFPATKSSVYRNTPLHGHISWRRPQEIVEQPGFIVEGTDRFDVRQGKLGNCWMVAALACLSDPDHRSLFQRVVPPGQSFEPGSYTGIFRFNFWRFGEWEEVIVDDRLPTRRGALTFIKSSQGNEFWAALAEKAYAKWNGYYMALKGGRMADSFTDLTGGVNETYSLQGSDAIARASFISIVSKAVKRKSLIGCAVLSRGSGESRLANGLVAGHAYSLTDLETVKLQSGSQVELVRIRNPWGNSVEWKGDWGDASRKWNDVSPEEKARLQLKKRNDGEFWMTVEDFLKEFYKVDICNLTPDCPEGTACRWHSFQFHGRWMKSTTAGGRPGKDSHWRNPKYLLNLTDTDDDDPNRCSFLVQLLQSDQDKDGNRTKILKKIGFAVYQKLASGQPRKIADSGPHSKQRQVVKRFSLPPGQYYVVPSTYQAGKEADFYIRFFFEEGNTAECLQGGQ